MGMDVVGPCAKPKVSAGVSWHVVPPKSDKPSGEGAEAEIIPELPTCLPMGAAPLYAKLAEGAVKATWLGRLKAAKFSRGAPGEIAPNVDRGTVTSLALRSSTRWGEKWKPGLGKSGLGHDG
jgi:hypothetical protein